MFLVKQFLHFISSKPWVVLIACGVIFVLGFGSAVITKYHFYLYNALDLAIFNNSLWNFIHGNDLTNAIHPPSYWADHVSPWLLILALPYTLWPNPQLLLLAQIITLAACSWPLYAIARNHVSARLSALIAGLWLANPLIHNMSIYEFSMVPWSMFFLLWTYYWYEKSKFSYVVIFSLLALSTREDVALVLIGFSILAIVDKRSLRWLLTPTIIGLCWFAITQYIINLVSPIGQSKFLHYYS